MDIRRRDHRNRRPLGFHAESVAAEMLEAQGCAVLDRNPNFRVGELDLVLLDQGTIVFCEVRYRRIGRYGCGATSVTRRKRRRIALAARAWLARRPWLAQWPCRFDVASVWDDGACLMVDVWRDAFTLDDC
ncbi:YraN family protein [Arenimonas composti]|uniref:UPF0102 protein P873_03235 n=1 Tax=Arenimonas composti TR7-09 = DSM 18010 TaxID=1121013 RepID=A0A091BKG2_9GAMM|nr:YraN family protein [Arenimonas composti]KFN51294.1 hypothetical protein P873_03235 [Arenimonas composti TR7-09 = DSM 18010]